MQQDHLLSLFPWLRGDPRVVELPNGVDTELFRPVDRGAARAELAIPDSSRVLLFVGALDGSHWFKNVAGLLRTFARRAAGDDLLLVSGDGDLRHSLERLAAQLGLTGRVRFLGAKSQEELPPIYSAADVTVLPSLEIESFGLVLLESLACGTPVIASDLPGVRTVVGRTGGGRLVPPGDEAALESAIDSLLDDPRCAREMGRQGRQQVLRHFGWEAVGDKLEQIYRDVAWRGEKAA